MKNSWISSWGWRLADDHYSLLRPICSSVGSCSDGISNGSMYYITSCPKDPTYVIAPVSVSKYGWRTEEISRSALKVLQQSPLFWVEFRKLHQDNKVCLARQSRVRRGPSSVIEIIEIQIRKFKINFYEGMCGRLMLLMDWSYGGDGGDGATTCNVFCQSEMSFE